MIAEAPPSCAECGTRYDVHRSCWLCGRLAGPGHAVENLVAGLCPTCLAESRRAEADRSTGRRPRAEKRPRSGKSARDRLIDLADAAKLAAVSPSTIRRWIASGLLKAHELPRTSANTDSRGRRIRVSEGDVRALIASHDAESA